MTEWLLKWLVEELNPKVIANKSRCNITLYIDTQLFKSTLFSHGPKQMVSVLEYKTSMRGEGGGISNGYGREFCVPLLREKIVDI